MGGVSEHGAGPVAEAPRDLPDLLRRLVRQSPDRPVAVDTGPDGESITVTRAQLWDRTCRLAAELETAGVGRGECVAVWMPNWSDALAWQLAVAARGAHVIGINTRYQVDEVTHLLDRARPVLVALAHGFHGLDLSARLRTAVGRSAAPPPAVAVITGPGRPPVDDPGACDVGGGAWIPAAVGDAPEPGPSDPSELVAAFTTSGSTGLPKLAAHRGEGVLAHAVADAAAMGVTESDAVLCVLPLSGVFGFNTAMAGLAGGAACVLEPVFDPDTVLDRMARHRVTHAATADDIGLRLQHAQTARARDLSAWRWWGLGDFQGRSRELAEWAETTLGTGVTGIYGSSEAFALLSFWPSDESLPRRWAAGGRVVHERIEVRVTEPATGEVLAPGSEGELQFRGPNVVDAYLGSPDAAARAFTGDGWLRSGDLGVLVEPGVFTYTCRTGDALRLRGFLVDPAEIELRLAAHPEVYTAKVVGVSDADGVTLAVAFVVAEPGTGPDPDALREWCAQGMARFKVPHAVHVIDEMPTTSGTNGTKIRAATLREWAADAR